MLGVRKAEVEALRKEAANTCKLIGIDASGAQLVLTFERNGECFQIETYRSMSLDVAVLRKLAGL